MIDDHGHVHEAVPVHFLGGKGDSHFSSCSYHHLKITSQEFKSIVEQCSYIFHESSIRCKPHLLSKLPAPKCCFCVSLHTWERNIIDKIRAQSNFL